MRRTTLDLNACLEKVACQRQEDRAVLVVRGAVDSLKRINPRKFKLYDHPTEKWPKNSRHS